MVKYRYLILLFAAYDGGFFMPFLRRLFLTFLDRLRRFLQCNHIIAVCL